MFLRKLSSLGPRALIQYKDVQYRKSHCGDKTVVRSSYLHNWISYTGKTTYLYWIRARETYLHCFFSSWYKSSASMCPIVSGATRSAQTSMDQKKLFSVKQILIGSVSSSSLSLHHPENNAWLVFQYKDHISMVRLLQEVLWYFLWFTSFSSLEMLSQHLMASDVSSPLCDIDEMQIKNVLF